MKITNVTYTRRMPVEQYGYEEMSATAALGDNENFTSKSCELRDEVNRVLNSSIGEFLKEENEKSKMQGELNLNKEPQIEVKCSDNMEQAPVKEKVEVVEDPNKEYAINAETGEKVEITKKKMGRPKKTATEYPSEVTLTPIVKPAPEEIKEKVVKPSKKNVTVYDRNIEIHRDELKVVLAEVYPDWKTLAGRAKDLSFHLTENQTEFLDSEGVVLESFKTIVKEYMELK